jgi:hypothetical protein
MAEARQRSYEMNAGYLNLPDIPDDRYIAGAIIVTIDEEGEYRTHFVAESLDEVPHEDVQETLGRWVAHAWHTANTEVSS